MAKFSELFGRKADETEPRPAARASGSPSNGNGNGHGQPINVENVSDLGSRMGEQNEALRNLLSDTGRKIGELDDLKDAFEKIVAPFNNTLRALEQEKSQSLSLAHMLTEARNSYDTLRTEFYLIEKKAVALSNEVEKLREELELAREANRGLESARLELTDELNTRNTQLVETERQLAQESAQRRALAEGQSVLEEQYNIAEKKGIELEGELAGSREKLALLEDEKRTLQAAVDSALNEVGRVTRRLTESENNLTATRAQLGKVEASFAEAYSERGRLTSALSEAKEQHQADHNNLNMRLDALQSRAATSERLLGEARQNLVARTEEVRAFDRKAVEATIGRNNAEKRLAQIEASHEARERLIKDLEQSRAAITERAAALAKTLKSRETALTRAEEKITALADRNAHLEADIQISRTNIEKRIEDLSSALQREQMERAVIEGALEAARKDNSRLQSEAASLRSTLRRGLSFDEAPMAPNEPANDEAAPAPRKDAAQGEGSKS